MTESLNFHALLYVAAGAAGQQSPNLRGARSEEAAIAAYLRMAARLSIGIHRSFGGRLTIVTNNRQLLLQMQKRWAVRSADHLLEFVEIEFPLLFPKSARFYSASHKLSLNTYLAEQSGFSVVLDLDMLCLRPFPKYLRDLIDLGNPLVYDISDQVIPAYGYSVIANDLSLLSEGEIKSSFRWYGGEFLGGPPEFFAELKIAAEQILPNYLAHHSSLHHQGDEIITTAALNLVTKTQRFSIQDVAPLDLVRRFWGTTTLYPERPLPDKSEMSFIHLPAKKALLASRFSDKSIIKLLRWKLLSRIVGRFLSLFT